MNTATRRLFVCIGLLLLAGCESRAANGVVEILLEGLSQRDIDPESGQIRAIATVYEGACVRGPCSPNPCRDDLQGKTLCRAEGDMGICYCPAGKHPDPSNGLCVADMKCEFQVNGAMRNTVHSCNVPGVNACVDNMGMGPYMCSCAQGWVGPNCEECDAEFGMYLDGFGNCTTEIPEICRDGQGTASFRAILDLAESEMGRPAVELELASATMEIVQGSAEGVRSWDYLFNGEVTMFLQTLSGFPTQGGRLDIREEAPGLLPIPFDLNVTRTTTSSDPEFMSGDFKVGIAGATDRQLTEEFSVDLKLVLEFNAY